MREGIGCPRCGERVERRGRRGPWPTYCSVPCRRATQYEVARLRRRLARVERERDGWIDADRSSNGFWSQGVFTDGRTFHEIVGAMQRDAARIAARLDELGVPRSPARRPRAGSGASHRPGTHGGVR